MKHWQDELEETINDAFEKRAEFSPETMPDNIRSAILTTLDLLNTGELRVADQMMDGKWVVNQWAKKAVLLSFRLQDNQPMSSGINMYYDKVPTKFKDFTREDFKKQGARIVPPATVRRGAYIGPKVVLMPSYVNIGAYVGEGSMIDTWATVGSCAQVGKDCHISGGAGLGGVLEPLQANPTIIEDNCFIGARSEIVEGVIVKKGSVIGMGVFISASTKIYNRETGQITYGEIPENSVVVPGSLPAKDGSHSLNAAIIIKQVDDATRAKTSPNELLRND